MNNRILKDIRYYEIKPDDFKGKFDGILGNVYIDSIDSKFIGQRIARKLNEFKFISGEFDHIYINFSAKINDDKICESNIFLDKQIKSLNYGIKPSVFNKLTEIEKNTKIKEITFKVLYWIYHNDDLKVRLINDLKNLIDKYGKHLIINYKTKETNSYLIDLNFQIRPNDNMSKLIIKYTNKKNNIRLQSISNIQNYEDLYSLIDKVISKDGFIVFKPKKSYHAELVAKKYNNPLTMLEINKMTTYNKGIK